MSLCAFIWQAGLEIMSKFIANKKKSVQKSNNYHRIQLTSKLFKLYLMQTKLNAINIYLFNNGQIPYILKSKNTIIAIEIKILLLH